MTAMSAQSASETPSNSPVDRTVLLPGSPATYANRAALREMGLRWDPVGHRWRGTTTADRVKVLREQLGLEVRCFGTLEVTLPRSPRPGIPRPRFGDYSRTRFESRVAFGGPDEGEGEDASELVTPTRQFGVLEITSGLPDDSREEDERAAERRLRELRGRVKAARVAIAATPGAEEALRQDWRKAARLYAHFAISEAQFRHGVPAPDGFSESDGPGGSPRTPADGTGEAQSCAWATLPA